MIKGNKLHNGYVNELGALYWTIPKAVIGAVAVSRLSNGGDEMKAISAKMLREWHILNINGIVPQRVPSHWKKWYLAATGESLDDGIQDKREGV